MTRRHFIRMAGLTALMLPVYRVASAMMPDWRIHGERLTLVNKHAFLMGSVFTFSMFTSDEKQTLTDLNLVIRRIRDLESRWSVFRPDSLLSGLNKQAGRNPVLADPDTIRLLTASEEAFLATGGLFDITVEPVMRAYGFRQEKESAILIPSDNELRELESAIGFRNLVRDGDQVYLRHPLSAVDSGGIACGYALDDAAQILRNQGYDRFLLNFSGDLLAMGTPPDEPGWLVDIVNPIHPDKPITVTMCNQALSTSGAYENRRGTATASWGHLINPITGKPSEPVASVTVMTASGIAADYLSTAGYLDPSRLPQWKATGLISDYRVVS